MKMSGIILIVPFALLGILTIFMGLNVDLKCAEATARDNILAGLPLWTFGVYCLVTSLLLWRKPKIGNILAVITVVMFSILILASFFDLSIAIIKTSCLNL
jgi:hypothetical protein